MENVPDPLCPLPLSSSNVHHHEITASTSEQGDPWDTPPPIEGELPSSYQLFRHGGWLHLRQKMRRAMEAAALSPKTVRRFDDCGRHSHLYVSPSTGKHSIRGDFCKCRTCAPCAAARSRLISSNLIDFLGDRTTRFLTLTIKHHNAPLPQLLTRIWRSFKLLRTEAGWKENVDGYAAFLEVKWSERSKWWHVHLHVLLEGKWWDAREISRLWHACTGDSFIIDIQAKGTNASRAYYASKYASKPFDPAGIPSFERLTEAVQCLHRRKLWQVGGTWKSLRLLAKPDATVTDWQHVCSLNQLFNDARSGNPAAIALVNDLTRCHEERTLIPPPDLPPVPQSRA